MGGEKDYLESGGFSNYEYREIGYTDNGIKIIQKKHGKANTPMKSNTPNTNYAKINDRSKELDQVTSYKGRQKQKDIDTGHIHVNPGDKRRFEKENIHVHDYVNGKRLQNARSPSKKEKRMIMIARYGGKK